MHHSRYIAAWSAGTYLNRRLCPMRGLRRAHYVIGADNGRRTDRLLHHLVDDASRLGHHNGLFVDVRGWSGQTGSADILLWWRLRGVKHLPVNMSTTWWVGWATVRWVHVHDLYLRIQNVGIRYKLIGINWIGIRDIANDCEAEMVIQGNICLCHG